MVRGAGSMGYDQWERSQEKSINIGLRNDISTLIVSFRMKQSGYIIESWTRSLMSIAGDISFPVYHFRLQGHLKDRLSHRRAAKFDTTKALSAVTHTQKNSYSRTLRLAKLGTTNWLSQIDSDPIPSHQWDDFTALLSL